MIIRAVESFGVAHNLSVLSLLPYQELEEEQLRFFLDQQLRGIKPSSSREHEIAKEYNNILKKTILNQSQQVIKVFIDELPADYLKAIYQKKWKNVITRDLFKLYSQYSENQLYHKMFDLITRHRRKVYKKFYLIEIKVLAEVLYLSLHRSKNLKLKKQFLNRIETYFANIGNRLITHSVKRKVYSLEACAYLINAGWWSLDKLIPKILEIFTMDCEAVVYEEAMEQLLEMDIDIVLPKVKALLLSGRVDDSAYPHLLRLLYLPIDFDDTDAHYAALAEEILLSVLKKEKYFSRKVQLALAISNLFSEQFIPIGKKILKSQSQLKFAVPSYAKHRAILEERLLVHSLITGVYIEGLETFVNNYIEKKPTLAKRINASLFFYRKKPTDPTNPPG